MRRISCRRVLAAAAGFAHDLDGEVAVGRVADASDLAIVFGLRTAYASRARLQAAVIGLQPVA